MNSSLEQKRGENIRILFTVSPGETRDALWSEAAQAHAAQLGFNINFNPYSTPTTEEQWAELLADVDALITTWKAPCLDENILKYNQSLKIVGHAAGSVAQIISPELFRRGIRIVSANTEMACSVAQWSLMMTLTALWRFLDYSQIGGKLPLEWHRSSEGTGIHKAVIGILGGGEVARQLIKLLQPLSPREILVCSDYVSSEEAVHLGVRKVELDELFQKSDVVHLLEGLTESTRGKVERQHLAALRDGAVIINAGRAPLVDEQAFLDHLGEQRTTAILDVHYQEPLPLDSIWRTLSNVVLTPHCAGWGRYDLYVKLVLEEFNRFFHGLPLKHEIAPERALKMTDDRLLV